MKRRNPSQINIWPGFVDAISTLLLVFIFLLVLFMVAQTFLTQALSGKNTALENLKKELNKLDADFKVSKLEKEELTKLIFVLNEELKKLDLNKKNIEDELLEEKKLTKKYLFDTKELEAKLKSLFDELGIEKLKLSDEIKYNKELKSNNLELNDSINQLNSKLIELENSLSLSIGKVKDKEIEVKNLTNKLDFAMQKKIGELEKYRSEFFGKLREILVNEKEIVIVGDRFVLQSEIFFKSGSALVEKKGVEKIIEIASLLEGITNKIPNNIDWLIQVEGHTDNVPISNKEYPSNWELSAARAISVAKIMIKNGIEPFRINVAGYGQFKPLVENNTIQNRERNRRIELKLTQP